LVRHGEQWLIPLKQPLPVNSTNGDSSDSGNEDFSPITPPDAPPAYTGTARSIKRSSYAARHDLNGTVVREADLGNGCGIFINKIPLLLTLQFRMDTLRPVKRLDAAGSLRASQEYVGSNRSREAPSPIPVMIPPPSGNERSPTSPNKLRRRSAQASVNARAGKLIVNEVLVPTLQRCIKDDMDAREIEALSMISKGFEDLRDVNPEMSYDVVLDLLNNLNEYVPLSFSSRHWFKIIVLTTLSLSLGVNPSGSTSPLLALSSPING
jgi:serine/threonine-protein kinase 24/25/MST4